MQLIKTVTLACALFVSSAVADTPQMDLSEATVVKPGEPLIINHSPGEEVSVTRIGTKQSVDEGRVIRLTDRTIIAADSGFWLASVGTRFQVFMVLPSDVPEALSENPKPTETQLTRIPVNLPPASGDGLTIWYFWGDNCPPCDLWKKIDKPQLESVAGIKIHSLGPGEHSRPTPSFILAKAGQTPVLREGRWDNWTDAKGILEYMRK